MNFYVMTEQELSNNFWNEKYMTGIRTAVRECKGTLIEVEFSDLDSLSEINQNERLPIIINGRSPDWVASHTEYVSDKGFHSILLASHNNTSLRGVSSLTFDFYGIYKSWCSYMCKRGWRNMALLGVSSDNMSDSLKNEAFCDYNRKYNSNSNVGVYYVKTSLLDCCKTFLSDAKKYDVVLCTNDVVAILLNSLLANNKNIHSLHIHSFWDTPLCEFISPEIKMMSLDYQELGRQAIRLYSFLVNNPGMESVSATVCGVPYIYEESDKTTHICISENAFLRDKHAQDIYTLERLISTFDELDHQIIAGILRGVSYEQIAECELVSVGTVKYRLKKMLTVANKTSREELIDFIGKYLQSENFFHSL